MLIKRVRVKNYRSFKELDITLDDFNIMIGANASGKSNFICIFNFLKNLAEYGLDDAISLVGGIEFLRNVYLPTSNSTTIEVEIEIDKEEGSISFLPSGEMNIGISPTKYHYKLEIETTKDQKEYRIKEELIKLYCEFIDYKYDSKKKKIERLKVIDKGYLKILRRNGDLKIEIKSEFDRISLDNVKDRFFYNEDDFKEEIKPHQSIIKTRRIPLISFMFERALKGIYLYDINPKPLKNFSFISGKSELESDGSNLILILKKLLNDKEKEEKLSEIIKDFLPFIQKITVDKLADKYIYANIKEIFSKEIFLPASLMSDGTIKIIALIIILFFEKKPLIIIEEPEGNIHPFLISKVIEMMKDVSSRLNKQIIITTHNSEVVKYSGIDHLFLVHRSEKGFSEITKPMENEDVRIFLENDMGLDELFIQNLLK